MVAVAVYGLFQLELFGLNLKYGVVEATVVEHVAVNNHQKVVDQAHMLAEQFV